MKIEEKKEAIKLRKNGKSIRFISRILNISKSSINRWVDGIGNQATEKWRIIRWKNQKKGRFKARKGNLLHIAGCMLFWAEGSKKRNSVIITNSDPFLLKFFIKFLKNCYNIKNEDFFMSVNAYTDFYQISDIEKYWLNMLGLPKTCLKKPTINKYSKYSSQKKAGKLPYGTCRIGLHNTNITQNIYGAIQEYANFNKPEWL